MALLRCFDPPAYLADYDAIPGQREAWDEFISRCFDVSIASEAAQVKRPDASPGVVQFYNPAAYDPGGPVIEQAIVWNAFPKELQRIYGRDRALVEADRLWPLRRYGGSARPGSPGFETAVYRPLDEYCEWHVVRDRDTNKITRVTFTSEPPEYWEAMFGTAVDPGDGTPSAFPGDRDRVLGLYREMVSPMVQVEDLICQETIQGPDGTVYAQQGQYNPYNKWNTTHGIVHLCSPPNSITAEIQLGADATVHYRNGRGGAGGRAQRADLLRSLWRPGSKQRSHDRRDGERAGSCRCDDHIAEPGRPLHRPHRSYRLASTSRRADRGLRAGHAGRARDDRAARRRGSRRLGPYGR